MALSTSTAAFQSCQERTTIPRFNAPDSVRIATAERRLHDERQRVLRCLDDIRHALGKPVKRRTGRPLFYAISKVHAAYLERSGREWLPLAVQAHRAARRDLAMLRKIIADRAQASVGPEWARSLSTAAE